MKVIIGGRGAGKTIELIKMAAGYKGYIVCSTRNEAHRVAEVAKSMELVINFPLTYEEVKRGEYHASGIGNMLIDNIDNYLEYTLGVPITAASISSHRNIYTLGGDAPY
ncbi:MAG: hypothetical protein AAFR36_33045 [Bacteroidota bacterium]